MNMMQQIMQTVRLVSSFKAFRHELDEIGQLPKEQAAEKEQRLSRLQTINMLEQMCLVIIFFSFLLMSIYDIGNYFMQLLHESGTWSKYLYIPVFVIAVVLFLSVLVGIFSFIWEKLAELEARIEDR
jgi:hypothetical protein